MDTSHPACDLEQRSAAAEQVAIAGAAPPAKLEDLLGGGVVNGESASGGGDPVAAPPEATAPEQGKAVDSFGQHTSAYHGVTGDHHHGRWQARTTDKKDAYLGTFSSQEEATEAYDIGAIKFRGLNAVTKFEISRDEDITASSTSQAKEDQLELESISDSRSSHQ